MNILTKALSAASSAASGKLVLALAGALLMTFTAFAVQTWRIGNLHEKVGGLEAEIDECVRANESNQRTITSLTDTAERNRQQAQAALDAQRAAALQITKLEGQLAERASDDITAIQDTDDACANARMPDDIRLRLDPRRNRNGGSPGNPGAPGSG